MPFFKKLRKFSRHKKLCEEWALANSRECVEGTSSAGTLAEEPGDASEVRFTLKYLGSTLVETPSSEEATAEAIKTVITMAKASGRKLQRVSLTVSLKGIRMTDLATEEDQLRVSIYRISYCSADAAHDHVFAFIATNLNETMECHAFLCPKRKMAQTVTLTVAQAFNTAYEAWRSSQLDSRIDRDDEKIELEENNYADEPVSSEPDGANERDERKNLLIDLSNEPESTGRSWVCFEEDSSQDRDKGHSLSTLGRNADASSSEMTGSTVDAKVHHQQHHRHHHHVVPRPSIGFKMHTAWGECRSLDLMCS